MNASITSFESEKETNPVLIDEKIKQNFLHVHPVMLEILHAPHASKVVRQRAEAQLRRRSAQHRQTHIQSTAKQDLRYVHLVDSLTSF